MDLRGSTWISTKWITFLVAVAFCFPNLTLCNNGAYGISLADILPSDYDTYQTPRTEGKAADVCIQIEILNIRSVNVALMSYVADIFLYKTWNDARLKYPANITSERVALNPNLLEHMWTPDVYFHNALMGTVQNTIIPYVYLWLRNDSTVVYGARLSLMLGCNMELYNFPHDSQYCEIIMKSLTHTLSEMNLHWSDTDPITVGDFILLPQFEFSEPFTNNCTAGHMKGKHGQFACLRSVIKLTRRSGYYVINIYIPTILIVFMSMLTFWIPADAVPGRVTLGVTSLLTIITKRYQSSVPIVSYVMAVNVWLSFCTAFVFCSILEYAAVVSLLSYQKRLSEKPISGPATDTEDKTGSKRTRVRTMLGLEKLKYYNIDFVCRFAFPAAFALFCGVYWALCVNI